MSKDLVAGLIVFIVLIAVILAPVFVFLIRRSVGRHMRQRVRPLSGAMPVAERHVGVPAAPGERSGAAHAAERFRQGFLRAYAERPPERGGDLLSRRCRRGIGAGRR